MLYDMSSLLGYDISKREFEANSFRLIHLDEFRESCTEKGEKTRPGMPVFGNYHRTEIEVQLLSRISLGEMFWG